MSRSETQVTSVPPGADLSNEVTVFVSTVGAPSFDVCLEHLDRQDCRFPIRIIDHVAPMDTAFQKMMDDCTTPYYVQVDEDMLLNPDAVRWLYNRMIGAAPEVAIVVAYLFDTHLEIPLQGIKMFRHGIVRQYPFNRVEACELDHNQRLKSAGYTLDIVEPEDLVDSENGTLGVHGAQWTRKAVYERYATLERKYRRYPERLRKMEKWPGMILERFLKDGSEADLLALMGILAGRLEPLDGGGREKDYRTYDALPGFDQAKGFAEVFARSDK